MAIRLDETNAMKLKEARDKLEANKLQTGIWAIDKAFTALVKGGVYAFCAGTGVGKTTLLLATAKKMAADGKKVLYITTEMSLVQLSYWLPEVETNLWIGTSDELEQDLSEYDVIVYDYLGADLADWDDLVDQAETLANVAIEYNIIVFTALQARPEIYDNTKEENLSTNMFVAFSKGMINKMSGAAYIVKKNNQLYLYVMKNRYGPCGDGKGIKLDSLDYSTKSWLPQWF